MAKIFLSWKRDSIFDISLYISKSFYRICVVKVSKSKSMNKYLESKNF